MRLCVRVVCETNVPIRTQMKMEWEIQTREGGGRETERRERTPMDLPNSLGMRGKNELGSLAQDGPCDWV